MQVWTIGDVQVVEVDKVLSPGRLAKGHIARAVIIIQANARVLFIDKCPPCQDDCPRLIFSRGSVSERIRIIGGVIQEQR